MAWGLKRVANLRTDALAQTHWAKVERLLADHYRKAGYAVEHCGTGAHGATFDGGVDLRLRRGDETIVVQCKHWNVMQVTHNAVHELLGIMVNQRATGAIVVTSGEFTKAAIEAATRHGHVQLIDGDDLRAMLGPLPEPGSGAGWLQSETGRQVASIGRYAGGRLLDAAEDRIRGGTSKPGVAVKLALIKGAIALVFMFFVLIVGVIWWNHFVSTVKAMGNPTPKAVVAPVEKVVAPQEMTPQPASASPPAYHEPTKEEIRESQRKADEAIKVLEATTPEV